MILENVTVTAKMLEEFCINFINELNNLKKSLRKFGVELNDALPEVFKGGSVKAETVYSHDKQHVLIIFRKSLGFGFKSSMCTGDVFNIFDPSGLRSNGTAVFKIEGVSNIKLKNIGVSGMKPFELYGPGIDMVIDKLELAVPYLGKVNIEYAFIMSCDVFLERSLNLKEYVDDFSKVYWEYHTQNKPKKKFEENYENIKLEMERLFFDEKILEQEIDDFISENSLVLEHCLGLIRSIRQVELKNIHGTNPKDFRPDLLAFDQNNNTWKIVDYKRAKRTIIRNEGKARAHFRAEITELEAQLLDYVEYFADKQQRDYVFQKYGVSVEYPEAIGIIGNVASHEQREFNRLKNGIPRWLDIVPYNYLYERYCRFLDTVSKVMNS